MTREFSRKKASGLFLFIYFLLESKKASGWVLNSLADGIFRPCSSFKLFLIFLSISTQANMIPDLVIYYACIGSGWMIFVLFCFFFLYYI